MGDEERGVEEGGRMRRECRGRKMGRQQGLEKGRRLESGGCRESKRRKGRVLRRVLRQG